MLTKEEFNVYKGMVESKETLGILDSLDSQAISMLGADFSVYYARVNNELALIKDAIMAETFRLSQTIDEKGKPMAMGRAETEGEININNRNEVTRRQMEALCEGLDKIGFACSARVRSFSKEGSF